MTADPIGLAVGSLSLYAYVDAQPTRLIDLMGLASCKGTWARMGVEFGVAINFVSPVCLCRWLCIPCRDQVAWSGNMKSLASTVGATFIDFNNDIPHGNGGTGPNTGTGGGAAGAASSNLAKNDKSRAGRASGSAVGGSYNCLCTSKPGPETSCLACFKE